MNRRDLLWGKAVEIANLDVEKLIEMLNGVLAEEWLAFYQYWIGKDFVTSMILIECGKTSKSFEWTRMVDRWLLELLGLYETDLKAKGEMWVSLNDGYNYQHLSVEIMLLEESEIEMKKHPPYLLTLKSMGQKI